MAETKLVFDGQERFAMSICYIEDMADPEHSLGQHMHAECEIYFHLGGDVSFMVEDKIYPIQYGNVIITRKNEYHHCIYHKMTKHCHFCILFSANDADKLLEMFFARKKGEGNLLLLSQAQIVELTEICEWLGMRDAINLDGGSSSTMWGETEGVINYPCRNKKFDHAGERKVSSCVLVKSKKK